MTEIVTLLIGILVATLIFAATFFSAAQVFRQTGALRYGHFSSVALTLAIMACLSAQLWLLSQISGGALALTACVGFGLEHRWNRVLPLVQVVFGGVAALGLPFGG